MRDKLISGQFSFKKIDWPRHTQHKPTTQVETKKVALSRPVFSSSKPQ